LFYQNLEIFLISWKLINTSQGQ